MLALVNLSFVKNTTIHGHTIADIPVYLLYLEDSIEMYFIVAE